MNFDDLLNIFTKAMADPYSTNNPKDEGSGGGSTSSKKASSNPYGDASERASAASEAAPPPNKDSSPIEPAQTPNNSQGGGKKKGLGGHLKDLSPVGFKNDLAGNWGKIADNNNSSGGGDGEINSAQQRSQARKQNSTAMSAARLQRQAQARGPQMTQKAFNPALASLLAVAAGYAASDSFVSGSGGRTNKDITDGQIADFNRASRNQTKARQQTKRNRSVTSKVKNIRLAYKEISDQDNLTKVADILSPDRKENEASAKAKIEAMRSAKQVEKAHAPVPPIQGLVWDQGSQRWRKPENVGKTATEVQGKKRIRGSGLGQTARSVGGTASGKGRTKGSAGGRRGRQASGDLGVAGKSKVYSAKKRKTGRK
jgi:hypothetical protein|tara:strand:+ start:3574 stop:4683 length:1110 start_codon:yes stop_codon:yes gene_type:complete